VLGLCPAVFSLAFRFLQMPERGKKGRRGKGGGQALIQALRPASRDRCRPSQKRKKEGGGGPT